MSRRIQFLAAIAALHFLAPQAICQRCAGSVDYLVRDEKGEIISAVQVAIRVIPIKGYEYHWVGISPIHRSTGGTLNIRDFHPTAFRFGTGCSRPLISVVLEYHDVKMTLHFKNIPDEFNIYIDSLPFQAGEFELDLKPLFEPPNAPLQGDRMQTAKQMSDFEKEKNIYLRELKDKLVIPGREWKQVK